MKKDKMGLHGFLNGIRRQRTRIFIAIIIVVCIPGLTFLNKEFIIRPTSRTQLTAPQMLLPRINLRLINVNKACWQQKKKKRAPGLIYTPPVKANLYVEPKHNVFYCPVQKAGSSFWMRTLTAMSSDDYSNPFDMLLQHHTLMYHNSWESLVSKEERQKVLRSAFTFMFVREPYGRFYSAYIDKIYFPNKVYWPKFTRKIAQTVRKKNSNFYDITFAETVRYFVKMYDKEPDKMDIHFRPMNKLCDPCSVNYKFIGKLETFQDDVTYLLDHWKSKYNDINVTFNDFEKESDLDDIKRHVSMLFYVIDNIQFPSEMTKYKILQRGWSDLHIRGFVSKHLPLPFTELQAPKVTRDLFMAKVENALSLSTDREAVKLQREEAMIQAYRTLTQDDLNKLRRVLHLDCQLFDYECSPETIFNRAKKPVNKHKYMQGM